MKPESQYKYTDASYLQMINELCYIFQKKKGTRNLKTPTDNSLLDAYVDSPSPGDVSNSAAHEGINRVCKTALLPNKIDTGYNYFNTNESIFHQQPVYFICDIVDCWARETKSPFDR